MSSSIITSATSDIEVQMGGGPDVVGVSVGVSDKPSKALPLENSPSDPSLIEVSVMCCHGDAIHVLYVGGQSGRSYSVLLQ